MNTANRLLRNSAWLITGQGCARAINFAYAVWLARTLGVDAFGAYSFVTVTVLAGGLMSDAGLSWLTVRDMARASVSSRFLVTVIALRAACSLGGYIGLVFILRAFRYSPDLVWLVVLGGLSLLPAGFAQVAEAVYQADERMDVVAALQNLNVVLNAGLGSAALLTGAGLEGVVVAWVGASTAHAVAYAALLRPRWRPFATGVHLSEARSILRAAAPFAGQALLSVVYFRAGPLTVGWLRSERELGIYAAAYRVAEGLTLVPSMFTMALFPIMAQLHRDSADALGRLYLASQRASAVIFGPVVVVGVVYARELVDLLYSSRYALAGDPLMLLMAGLMFVMLHASTSAVLLSGTALGPVVRHTGVVAGLSVALNLAFVPLGGATGAALANVLAQAATWLIFLRLIFLRLPIAPGAFLDAVGKPAIALAVLAGVLAIGRVWAPIGGPVLGSGVYALAVWRLGIIRPEEALLVRQLLARVLLPSLRRG
jgi:O-antigen/teichoic acid export membrane protein